MLNNDDPKYQPGEPARPDEQPAGVIISPDTRRAQRVPPGQARTRKWPVLHYGSVPHVPLSEWTLEIDGLVERPLRFNWDEFQALPRVQVFADFHCVTRWSRLSNVWEGVSTREILSRAGVRSDAKFALPLGYDDGWTTNLPLEHFLGGRTLRRHSRRRAALGRSRRSRPPRHPAALCVEERQVGQGGRTLRRRPSRPLGGGGVPRPRRPLARGTLPRVTTARIRPVGAEPAWPGPFADCPSRCPLVKSTATRSNRH